MKTIPTGKEAFRQRLHQVSAAARIIDGSNGHRPHAYVTVPMTQDAKRRLARIARAQNKTVGAVVNVALNEFIARRLGGSR
jgi:hypothetical protein